MKHRSHLLTVFLFISLMLMTFGMETNLFAYQAASDDLEVRPQDVLELTNGNRFIGKILIERDDFIKFETKTFLLSIQFFLFSLWKPQKKFLH